MSRASRVPADEPWFASLSTRLYARVRRAANVIRTIVGAPDYERYRRHLDGCHPGAVPMTREQFTRDRLARRYDQPGSRCC